VVSLQSPCTSDPRLFDSIELYDHYEARELCANCTTRRGCALIGLGDKEASGTYGGVLIVKGKAAVKIRAGRGSAA
jgi:hypothetical protein